MDEAVSRVLAEYDRRMAAARTMGTPTRRR